MRRLDARGLSAELCFLLYIVLVSCILFSSCGSDTEEERVLPPEESLRNGWDKYREGDYGAAMLAFEEVLSEGDTDDASLKPLMADAYNGLGWIYLGFSKSMGVNQKNIEMALNKFQEAVSLDGNNADAWVGRAGLFLARRNSQDDLRNALESIDSALQGDPSYLYRHDYDSEADLHALKAQCYYYLGELDGARSEIRQVLVIEEDNGVALAMRDLLD